MVSKMNEQMELFDLVLADSVDPARITQLVARGAAQSPLLVWHTVRVVPPRHHAQLLRAGLDVNVRDAYGLTPICHCWEDARTLVLLGARVRVRNAYGSTPGEHRERYGLRGNVPLMESRVLRCSHTALAFEAGLRAWRVPRDVRRLLLQHVGATRCEEEWDFVKR
jgi:hypothetical protein